MTVQFPSGSELPIPTSGQLIGQLADFLRIKGFVAESDTVSSKTAQRYYAGDRVEPKSVSVILDALLAPLHAELLVEREVFGRDFDAAVWVRATVVDLSARWDALASTLQGYFPIVSPIDAPLPFLRLVALDCGLRWAAYQAIRVSLGRDAEPTPPWLVHDAVRVVMDDYRPDGISVEKLARDGIGISKNAMEAWRSGSAVPTKAESSIAALAEVLAKYSGARADVIEARLRVATAVTAGWNALGRLVSHEGHVANLILGFETTARSALDFFKWLPIPMSEGERVVALREVIALGARSRAGAAACAHLAGLAKWKQEVATDLGALPGDWSDRINYWIKQLGTQDAAAHKLTAQSRKPIKETRELVSLALRVMMTMGDFDRAPPESNRVIRITGDDAFKASNRWAQAESAHSSGDYRSALEHVSRAIELQPQYGPYWRARGAWLGELVLGGMLELINDALADLREAVKLDPTDHTAANEIGIVLANAGLLEEAEKAYADAEPIASHWHHFHYARGVNYAYLGRFEDAERCFVRALDLQPNGVDIQAWLSRVLMKLGRKKDAERVAREVEHRSGRNPLDDWERALEARANAGVRWERRGDGWVAR